MMDETQKSKFSDHLGVTNMYRDLWEDYWWPFMKPTWHGMLRELEIIFKFIIYW